MRRQRFAAIASLLVLLLSSSLPAFCAERIGLFLGTFDPPHQGIARMVEETKNRLDLATIYLMPTPQPVDRSEVTPVQHRLAMLQLMALSVSGITTLNEADLTAIVSRSPENLFAALREDVCNRHPDADLFQIVGEDAMPKLIARRQLPEANERRSLVVFPRHGVAVTRHPDLASLEKAGQLIRIDVEIPDLAGRELRAAFAQGRGPADRELSSAISNYIRREGLYGLQPAPLTREIIKRFDPGPAYRAQPVLLHSPSTDTSFVPAHLESFLGEMAGTVASDRPAGDIPPALKSLLAKHVMQVTIFQSPTTDALDWLETQGWRTLHGFVPAGEADVPMLFFARQGADWQLFITGIFSQNRFLQLIADMQTLFSKTGVSAERLTILVPAQVEVFATESSD
ncbi:MAG TPA: hypothetical protein DCG57_12080 [Candidatus Riflebacteria bacterium]|jgi:nicotinate-nucleotide adenylyltransferase|nr:hypothetical protein [Candidatus Riflebacteria bacterium]